MKNLLLLSLIISIMLGCNSKKDFIKSITPNGGTNSSLTTANTFSIKAEDWSFIVGNLVGKGNPNNYQANRISAEANSGSPLSTSGLMGVPSKVSSYTLSIAASTIYDTTSLSYWVCRITPSTRLRLGQLLTLNAKVRLENVQGKGAALVLRGDKDSKTAVLFATTQDQTILRGTADFRDYSVTLPYSSSVDDILVYLTMLPQTTGKITFSDVSFQVN